MTEETKTEKDIQELIDLAFSAVVQTSVELEDDQLDALENLNQYSRRHPDPGYAENDAGGQTGGSGRKQAGAEKL